GGQLAYGADTGPPGTSTAAETDPGLAAAAGPAGAGLRGLPREKSDPALDRFGGVGGRGVKANLRVWRLSMDQVKEFLKQQQLGRRAQAGADYHAVEAPRLEMPCRDRHGGFAQINPANVILIGTGAKPI